jgi:hypothetical protein
MARAIGMGMRSFGAETRSAGRRGLRSVDLGAKGRSFIGGLLRPAATLRRERHLACIIRNMTGEGAQPGNPFGLPSKKEFRFAKKILSRILMAAKVFIQYPVIFSHSPRLGNPRSGRIPPGSLKIVGFVFPGRYFMKIK